MATGDRQQAAGGVYAATQFWTRFWSPFIPNGLNEGEAWAPWLYCVEVETWVETNTTKLGVHTRSHTQPRVK